MLPMLPMMLLMRRIEVAHNQLSAKLSGIKRNGTCKDNAH